MIKKKKAATTNKKTQTKNKQAPLPSPTKPQTLNSLIFKTDL